MERPHQECEAIPFRLPVEEELIDRVSWFIRLRWYAAPGVVFITWVVGSLLGLPIRRRELFLVGSAIAGYNLIHYLRLKALRKDPSAGVQQFSRFAGVQFIVDWVAVTLLGLDLFCCLL